MSDLNFDDLLGNEPLELECPNCKNEFQITLNQAGSKVTCPNCKSIIELQESESLNNSKKNVDNALNELDNIFKNFGK